MLLLYNIFIRLYYFGIQLASLWNKKAALWVSGRRGLFEELSAKISSADKVIWMHCSSAGEFEQGKPLIEALKKQYPNHKIVVSFFSPSGFMAAGSYAYADHITYLPLDSRKNAELFIKLLHPELTIFVKYEFWYHHLATAAFHHIPILLISAVFREEQVFFKPYGSFFRQMLFLFRHIFVQDKHSLNLLQQKGISHSSIGGDTRFDRVSKIAEDFKPLTLVENWLNDKPCIVAGSSWSDDEQHLQFLAENYKTDIQLIIAPHEIHELHLKQIKALFPEANFYSALSNQPAVASSNVLIIDNVGMLSRLYHYATIAYVGGGFTKDGIHNILEPAIWSKPVIIGPNYQKYREAIELIEVGGAFSYRSAAELKKLAENLFTNEQFLQASGKKAKNYILENTGSTEKILSWIQAKRLLTN